MDVWSWPMAARPPTSAYRSKRPCGTCKELRNERTPAMSAAALVMDNGEVYRKPTARQRACRRT